MRKVLIPTKLDKIAATLLTERGFEVEIRARQSAFLQDGKAVRNYKGAIRRLIAMAARLTRSELSFRTLVNQRQELRLCS